MKRLRIIVKKKTPSINLPIVSDMAQVVANVATSPLIAEMEKVIESKIETMKTEQLADEDIKVKSVESPSIQLIPIPSPVFVSACSKEKLENFEVVELLDNNKIDKEELFSDSAEFECKKLSNNLISARETARFKITVDGDKPILGFFFSLQSKLNFINANHIESIEDDKVALIVNNLTNKDVTFDINYIAIF